MRGSANKPGPYDDIINLPHHISATRPQMSAANRAAQFSPFAALTGYGAAVKETARLTDKRIELSESAKSDLDMKLRILTDRIADLPEVAVTYFQPDEKKEGGAYVRVIGAVRKIDNYERVIVLANNEKIAVKDILDMESALFDTLI